MDAEHILANMRHLHSDVTNQTLEVIAKLTDASKVVVEAAKKVEQGKTVIHRQNEALLMERVEEITKAINELKNVENGMQLAAAKQAIAVLDPVRQEMATNVGRLSEKNTLAAEYLSKALNAVIEIDKTQKKFADKMWIAALFGMFLFLAGFISAWAMFKH